MNIIDRIGTSKKHGAVGREAMMRLRYYQPQLADTHWLRFAKQPSPLSGLSDHVRCSSFSQKTRNKCIL
jgi:hypothetical protein